MSVQYAYYRPTTPPDVPLSAAHSRHASDSSVYSTDASSPWSVTTSATSPGGSPPRKLHHGPALLPKIRPQDVVVEPAPPTGSRQRRNTRNPPAPLPYVHGSSGAQRSAYLASPAAPGYSSSNGVALLSPVSITSSNKRKASSSPEGHSRHVSESRNHEAMLERYGYPTYRQLPRYIVPSTPATPNIVVHPPYLQQRSTAEYTYQQPPVVVSKMPQYYYQHPHTQNIHPYPAGSVYRPEEMQESTTTMLSYLTAPTQAIKLVRNVNVVPTRGMHDYFWWDIRNLRSWTSFQPSTFDSIDCLTKLLTTEIPSYLTPPTMVHPSRLAPECETTLIGLVNDIYAPRVNAALAVSQGPNHLRLYAAPGMRTSVNKNYGGPHFLANYSTDTDQTSSGLPRGRLVGIVRSFDRWNTGMRKEAEPRRVEYLNGLAHLQRCMREHSCRYGFIMTEIELVCVRAGCDNGDAEAVPYFGFLEISPPIPTKTSDDDTRFHSPALSSTGTDGLSSSTSSTRSRSRSSSHSPIPDPTTQPYYNTNANPQTLDVPLTTTLALYFLLMLSKDTPLPSQPSPHVNVGGAGALTRQKVLPEGRDKWIPKVHAGETRDAKRVRGWVWPEDPWHRREGGGVSSRRRGRTVSDSNGEEGVRIKRWHK